MNTPIITVKCESVLAQITAQADAFEAEIEKVRKEQKDWNGHHANHSGYPKPRFPQEAYLNNLTARLGVLHEILTMAEHGGPHGGELTLNYGQTCLVFEQSAIQECWV